jgi:hypothetical protein
MQLVGMFGARKYLNAFLVDLHGTESENSSRHARLAGTRA